MEIIVAVFVAILGLGIHNNHRKAALEGPAPAATEAERNAELRLALDQSRRSLELNRNEFERIPVQKEPVRLFTPRYHE